MLKSPTYLINPLKDGQTAKRERYFYINYILILNSNILYRSSYKINNKARTLGIMHAKINSLALKLRKTSIQNYNLIIITFILKLNFKLLPN